MRPSKAKMRFGAFRVNGPQSGSKKEIVQNWNYFRISGHSPETGEAFIFRTAMAERFLSAADQIGDLQVLLSPIRWETVKLAHIVDEE